MVPFARVLGVASGAAAVAVLLLQHHHRLNESAGELSAVVAMSRDLAQVRDTGQRIDNGWPAASPSPRALTAAPSRAGSVRRMR